MGQGVDGPRVRKSAQAHNGVFLFLFIYAFILFPEFQTSLNFGFGFALKF
jgi:nitrate reductase NapE component